MTDDPNPGLAHFKKANHCEICEEPEKCLSGENVCGLSGEFIAGPSLKVGNELLESTRDLNIEKDILLQSLPSKMFFILDCMSLDLGYKTDYMIGRVFDEHGESVTPKYLKESYRAFATMGIAELTSLIQEDTGKFAGRGYILTSYGDMYRSVHREARK